MSSPNFIDYVKIYARSGNGGAGSRHFRRAKYEPHGGPDGGDGGRGGHVIVRANTQLWTLLHLKYTKHVRAANGEAGSSQNCTGSYGKDELLEVPLGTVIKDEETEEVLAEFLSDGQEEIILQGGKGGLGNWHFKNSTNQAPEYAQPGLPGEERTLVLELKVLADVGLIGFPNAGKSTLLSVISAAKPKIGNYPFTTLTPNLGVVGYHEHSFVVADIPGLIEGASEGKGLGTRFLRHAERNSLLLFLIPADSEDPAKELAILENELLQHNPELGHRSKCYAVSKTDLLDAKAKNAFQKKLPKAHTFHYFSSVTREGVEELIALLSKSLNEINAPSNA